MTKKSGSGLLVIVIIMSAITLSCFIFWRYVTYAYEAALARQEYVEQYYKMYGVIQWAIVLCKQDFENLFRHILLQHNKLQYTLYWYQSSPRKYPINVLLQRLGDDKIRITVNSAQRQASQLSCTAQRIAVKSEKHDPHYYVHVFDWQTHA